MIRLSAYRALASDPLFGVGCIGGVTIWPVVILLLMGSCPRLPRACGESGPPGPVDLAAAGTVQQTDHEKIIRVADPSASASPRVLSVSPAETLAVPAPQHAPAAEIQRGKVLPRSSRNCWALFGGTPALDQKMIQDLNVDTRPPSVTSASGNLKSAAGSNLVPRNLAAEKQGTLAAAPQIGTGCRRYHDGNLALWAAPRFHHRPLYFEQPNLERYGHYVHGQAAQSALSAAHFFATIPCLPYKLGVQHRLSPDYTLGRYRPGNCNPHQLGIPPLSARGLAQQGLVVTGLVFLIP